MSVDCLSISAGQRRRAELLLDFFDRFGALSLCPPLFLLRVIFLVVLGFVLLGSAQGRGKNGAASSLP